MGFFPDPLYEPKYAVKGDEIAVFTTSKGTIRVALDGAGAPRHVANLCELAEAGYYDGLKFHRYVLGCRWPVRSSRHGWPWVSHSSGVHYQP